MSDLLPDPGRRQSSILEELERKLDKLLELPPRVELAISQRVPELPMWTASEMVQEMRRSDAQLRVGFTFRCQVAEDSRYHQNLWVECRTVDPRTIELTFYDAMGYRGSTYRFVLFARE